MNLHNLPIELKDMILSYLLEIPVVPTCEIIKVEIDMFNKDHHWYYARQTKFYYIHNILSFSEYYFDKMREPYDYLSYYGDISK